MQTAGVSSSPACQPKWHQPKKQVVSACLLFNARPLPCSAVPAPGATPSAARMCAAVSSWPRHAPRDARLPRRARALPAYCQGAPRVAGWRHSLSRMQPPSERRACSTTAVKSGFAGTASVPELDGYFVKRHVCGHHDNLWRLSIGMHWFQLCLIAHTHKTMTAD